MVEQQPIKRIIRDRILRSVDQAEAVAFLQYHGIKFVRYEMYGKRVVFLYNDTPEFRKILHTFENRTKHSLVDPLEYNAHMRSVIRLIKSVLSEDKEDSHD